MSIDNGGPAYPVSIGANMQDLEGMTLRDYATIKMMQAWRGIDEVMLPHDIVRLAQADADAFIAAREKS